MGCFLSREKGGISIYQQQLEIEAMRKFNARVANYSYPHHGLYLDYIEWCRAQFSLDCIPPSYIMERIMPLSMTHMVFRFTNIKIK